MEHATAAVRKSFRSIGNLPVESPVRRVNPRRHWLQGLHALLAGATLACALLLHAPCARALPAQYRLAVLALTSDSAVDPFAHRLAQSLRDTVDARPDYAVQDTRVSLPELSAKQRCSRSDGACLAQIAQSLGVDGFVFGDIRHVRSETLASLHRYDLWSGTIDRYARAKFTSNTPRRDEFERNAKRVVEDLVGPTPAKNSLPDLATPAAPRLAKPGNLAPADALSASRVAGYALLGGAVLSTGMSVISFVEASRAEHNRDYERYRIAVGESNRNVSDVCDEAAAGKTYGLSAASFREVRSACSRGSTFAILQFVFLGSAVVSGGLAAYFLTNGEGTKERPKLGNDTISLHPTLARKGFGLGASVKF